MKRRKEIKELDSIITYYSPYVDEFGQPIKRTPQKYPYSYDGYVTYDGTHKGVKENTTVYSDRLSQQDYEKVKKLKQKHFGKQSDWYSEYTVDQIEAFLRDFMDDPQLVLVRIMQYCNVSSGYPVWRFDFHVK